MTFRHDACCRVRMQQVNSQPVHNVQDRDRNACHATGNECGSCTERLDSGDQGYMNPRCGASQASSFAPFKSTSTANLFTGTLLLDRRHDSAKYPQVHGKWPRCVQRHS